MEEIEEKRLELNEEIYGVIESNSISFVHEDSTTYPDPVVVLLEDLIPGKLFDYQIVEEDITWILSMNDSFKVID